MRFTIICHKQCTREIFPQFVRMPQRYVCNKCYSVFNEKFKIGEEAFKELLKYINYVKVEATFFQMPYYIIKYGKSWVKTGEYIHFVDNEMFTCAFTISPFINCVFTISP